jgi:CheY-like chemotaxis protein
VRISARPEILIADAVPDQRELYADYFAWSGFQVAAAASVDELLTRLTAHVPDIICAAFDLPNADGAAAGGAALCADIRARLPRTPILLLATRPSSDDIARAAAAGCSDVLLKPVLPEQLLLEVRKHMPRARLLHALSQRGKLRAALARARTADSTQTADRVMRKFKK